MMLAVFLVASQVMYHLLQLTIRKQRSCDEVEERLHLCFSTYTKLLGCDNGE